jgi:hypothetical protein
MFNPLTSTYPIICNGTITWIYYAGDDDTVELSKAIVKSQREIILEFYWSLTLYTIALTSTNGTEYFSDFETKHPEEHSGTMRATLYYNSASFILFGKWLEDGNEMWVVARFKENA